MQKQVAFRNPGGAVIPAHTSETAGESDEEPPGCRPCPDHTLPISTILSSCCLNTAPTATATKTRHFLRPQNPTKTFRRAFFPETTDSEWNDWRWQIKNRIRTPEQLEKILSLSREERLALEMDQAKLPLAITPHFMSLLPKDAAENPLRRTVIPTVHEFFKLPDEADDPLGEEDQSPLPGLVHRYPDRVLFLALDFCSTYCRYCTRSRIVGHGHIYPSKTRWQKAIDYIHATPTIRDVLISGGDPLTLSDERLEWLLARLRQIPHIDIIRIGTKIPAVLPQRITANLVRMLRKYHPLWMSLHFTHPAECTPEAYRACSRLADAGIPLGSQTVLLRDINDSVATMKMLVHHLLRMRVRPYYLYQCDPISGSSHFRTPVANGLEIIRGLRGFTSGYAVPTYVIDAPGGGGKIALMPDCIVERTAEGLVLSNFENKIYRYPERLMPAPAVDPGVKQCM